MLLVNTPTTHHYRMPPRNYPELGRRLRALIERLDGGNQSKFALRIGRDRSQINRILGGNSNPSRDVLEAIGALKGENLQDWLDLAGLGSEEPDDLVTAVLRGQFHRDQDIGLIPRTALFGERPHQWALG